ncbi:YciI family protein [Amorphus sp. 3PC139-8]|uniref:YciI family protein n=1 Tax=Amorphus sp. 3PC139-8 TaxID=2735676 RepID=UPI00345D1CD0
MLFVAICRDKPNSADLRTNVRPDHIAWLEANPDKVKLGGPFVTEDGAASIGSMLIVEADTLEGAQAFLADDPYAGAGLFEAVQVVPWRATVGAKL